METHAPLLEDALLSPIVLLLKKLLRSMKQMISCYFSKTASKTWTQTLDPDPEKPGR